MGAVRSDVHSRLCYRSLRRSKWSGNVESSFQATNPRKGRTSTSQLVQEARQRTCMVSSKRRHRCSAEAMFVEYQYISAVLGVEPWLLHELRHVRNYISHQSKQSALEMRKNKLATAGRIMAVQSALSYGNDGVQRYLGWATFMKDVSRRLVQ